MNERWHIQHINGDTIIILTDIHKVSDYERELREKGTPYKTRMYKNNKPVSKFWEKLETGMIHWKEI